MSGMESREVRLRRRPRGLPVESDFEIVTTQLAAPGAGELLVQNLFSSVDPYMRGRMVDQRSYVPPFALNEPLSGGAVGRVITSNHERFSAGDIVLSMNGWREGFLSDGKGLRTVDASLVPPQAFLGVLGMPGLTAYVGLFEIGGLTAEDTVFVSAASGAVGSVAVQMAKAVGATVIGSAGREEKVAWLREVAGVDVAINYRTESLYEALKAAAPDGLSLYFDNVGADHLEAALSCLNPFGRIVSCGMIALYNAESPPAAPRNLALIVGKRLTMRGFIVSDHGQMQGPFLEQATRWIAEGKLKWEETIVDGIERMPAAFIGLFEGKNLGKMLVRMEP